MKIKKKKKEKKKSNKENKKCITLNFYNLKEILKENVNMSN